MKRRLPVLIIVMSNFAFIAQPCEATLLKDFNPGGDGYPGSVSPVSFVAGFNAWFVANGVTNAGRFCFN